MRRMNYPRFDKPTYVGTFDTEQRNFVMNDTLEPGIYLAIINNKSIYMSIYTGEYI